MGNVEQDLHPEPWIVACMLKAQGRKGTPAPELVRSAAS